MGEFVGGNVALKNQKDMKIEKIIQIRFCTPPCRVGVTVGWLVGVAVGALVHQTWKH